MNEFDDNVPFWKNEGRQMAAVLALLFIYLALPW